MAAPTTTLPAVGHVRGTAYTFDTPTPIAGATIRVEELPGVSATTGADGSYEPTVPLGATVTAYLEAAGHHSIHVQTFVVGDARMIGMPFASFIQFHPHGVPGAKASLDPPAAAPIYFDAAVLPDQAQHETSVDGGVLCSNVPPGTYTLTATEPGTRFATVHVRCEQDWVVNANPVWGLHALP